MKALSADCHFRRIPKCICVMCSRQMPTTAVSAAATVVVVVVTISGSVEPSRSGSLT